MFSAERLIDQYYLRLRLYAQRMLGQYPSIRRWEDTDDVTQLSLIRLIQALEATCPESELHFRRLACLQVRRMLIDLARSLSGPEGLARNHETNYGNSDFYDVINGESEERGESLNSADWEDFHQAVDRLSDEHKEMFDLYWYSGLSTAKVATILELNERTVQRRYRNARLALSRILQKQTRPDGKST